MPHFDDLAHLARRALAWQAEGVYQDSATAEALNAVIAPSKAAKGSGRRKYHNEPTETDAGMADSKVEAERWGELRLLERAGELSALTFHPRFLLAGGVYYEADSAYTLPDGRRVVEDVKGGKVRTGVFRIKWRQMAERYPDLVLRIEER